MSGRPRLSSNKIADPATPDSKCRLPLLTALANIDTFGAWYQIRKIDWILMSILPIRSLGE